MNTFRDYTELEDTIVDWMDRQDIRDKIPAFIRLVTVDSSRELRIPTMENTVILPMYADGTSIIPGDLIETISVNYLSIDTDGTVQERTTLNRASLHEYNNSREGEGSEAVPDSFATSKNMFKVFPLPYSKDTVVNYRATNKTIIGHIEVTYYVLPTTINEPDEDNWILEISPEIYFYGGMMHSYRYVRDYESAGFCYSEATRFC